VFTDNKVYTENQPLFVYGKATPNEDVIVRLFAPDETIAKFDQIGTDEDGSFNEVFLTWPEASIDFPFGTYTLEIISSEQPGVSKKIDLKFT
ncbi:MAG: methyl-accepting chemotaxis protein, partial [Gammaproteobacteria bacterium]|nr:methyl-accepting chemotaxis protein [Candidatus Bathyarchaeota archaeon]NIR92742.1 methyl-accepting chemotaxis protein [Gammaproteobacteria bacterium]NIW09461.1 methyl-accepting chemotaxis protein [Gammaproteobacteria bacterium]